MQKLLTFFFQQKDRCVWDINFFFNETSLVFNKWAQIDRSVLGMKKIYCGSHFGYVHESLHFNVDWCVWKVVDTK